jgi:hypothetical protein
MTPRFFYHTASDEPQHTFIQLPTAPTGAFGGWGPKL